MNERGFCRLRRNLSLELPMLFQRDGLCLAWCLFINNLLITEPANTFDNYRIPSILFPCPRLPFRYILPATLYLSRRPADRSIHNFDKVASMEYQNLEMRHLETKRANYNRLQMKVWAR